MVIPKETYVTCSSCHTFCLFFCELIFESAATISLEVSVLSHTNQIVKANILRGCLV